MRITRALVGTAVGGATLGASVALGLSMASAATSATPAARASRTSPAATSSTPGSPAPAASTAPRPTSGHKCPHMSGSAGSPASAPAH